MFMMLPQRFTKFYVFEMHKLWGTYIPFGIYLYMNRLQFSPRKIKQQGSNMHVTIYVQGAMRKDHV